MLRVQKKKNERVARAGTIIERVRCLGKVQAGWVKPCHSWLIVLPGPTKALVCPQQLHQCCGIQEARAANARLIGCPLVQGRTIYEQDIGSRYKIPSPTTLAYYLRHGRVLFNL